MNRALGNQISAGGCEARQAIIPSTISELMSASVMTRDTLESLVNRLNPLMRNEPCNPTPEECRAEFTVQMNEELVNVLVLIREINRIMRDSLDRLEV